MIENPLNLQEFAKKLGVEPMSQDKFDAMTGKPYEEDLTPKENMILTHNGIEYSIPKDILRKFCLPTEEEYRHFYLFSDHIIYCDLYVRLEEWLESQKIIIRPKFDYSSIVYEIEFWADSSLSNPTTSFFIAGCFTDKFESMIAAVTLFRDRKESFGKDID
jgi:hypothetical protein